MTGAVDFTEDLHNRYEDKKSIKKASSENVVTGSIVK